MAAPEQLPKNGSHDSVAARPAVATGLAIIEGNMPHLRVSVLATTYELADLQRQKKRKPREERGLEAKLNGLIDVVTAAGAELTVAAVVRSRHPMFVASFSPITWSEGDGKHRKYAYVSDCSSELRRVRLRDQAMLKDAGMYGIVNSSDLRYEEKLGHNRWYLHLVGEGGHFYIPVSGIKDLRLGARALPSAYARQDVPRKPNIHRKH
jgi:hypothetical protein